MDVNKEIAKLWDQLSTDSYQLATLEELDLTASQKQDLIIRIGQTARQIKHLQIQSTYDGSKLLKLPNGNAVIANAAIFGAMNFLKEMESELSCDFSLSPRKPPVPTKSVAVKESSDGIGNFLLGLVTGGVGLWCATGAVTSIINGNTGKIDHGTSVVLGIILTGVAAAAFFFTYVLFKNK